MKEKEVEEQLNILQREIAINGEEPEFSGVTSGQLWMHYALKWRCSGVV